MAWRPPEPIIDRARQISAGTLAPPEPRDAATVILLRDGAQGLEVHLQRRVTTMAFAAGMYVFPGGRVDDADFETGGARAPALPPTWPRLLGAEPARAAAVTVAACRETFEEAGVLVIDGPLPAIVTADPLAARGLPFASLGVEPSTTLMRPWARWVTPEFEPRRYDTRFFVAALPEDQMTAGDDAGGEADAAIWIQPAEALASHRRGELGMLPPTVFTLTELADFAAASDVLAAALARDCKPVLPRLLIDGDDVEFVLSDPE